MPNIETICRKCGKSATVDVDDFTFDVFSRPGAVYPWCCPTCKEEHDRVEAERERIEQEEERRNYIEEALERCGLPARYRVKAPPVPHVADWMKRHAPGNMLLTGETGTGKSTSAGYLARYFIEQGRTVRYRQMSDLLDQWREARCGETRETTADFLGRLERFDLLIIDEASADKTVVTDSAKECMWRLLEDIYNGSVRGCVVFLGNYYRGSLGDVFGNETAARRRLSEAFNCAKIDARTGKITKINL